MSLKDILEGSEDRVVNVYDYYIVHGVSDFKAVQLVLHMLLTRTYAAESDAREVAREFQVDIPFIFDDNGTLH